MRKSAFIIISAVVAVVLTGIILISVFCFRGCVKDGSDKVAIDGTRTITFGYADDRNNTTLEDMAGRECLVIVGNSTSWDDLHIKTDAKHVIISGLRITCSSGTVLSISSSSMIELTNVNFETGNGGCAVNIASVNAELVIGGSVTLSGGAGLPQQNGGQALWAESLTISGDGHLTLNGGKAGVGRDGSSGMDASDYNRNITKADWFSNGRNGSNGSDGGDGENGIAAGRGGDALACARLTVSGNVRITAKGGAGNRSGSGGDGGDGGDAEGAIKGQPISMADYIGGVGGDGGDAGSGADEQRPGYGLVCDYASISGSASVSSKIGARGSAGKAGEPGEGGYGGFSMNGGANASGTSGNPGADGKELENTALTDYNIGTLIGKIN